jgi:hypothetical protein
VGQLRSSEGAEIRMCGENNGSVVDYALLVCHQQRNSVVSFRCWNKRVSGRCLLYNPAIGCVGEYTPCVFCSVYRIGREVIVTRVPPHLVFLDQGAKVFLKMISDDHTFLNSFRQSNRAAARGNCRIASAPDEPVAARIPESVVFWNRIDGRLDRGRIVGCSFTVCPKELDIESVCTHNLHLLLAWPIHIANLRPSTWG